MDPAVFQYYATVSVTKVLKQAEALAEKWSSEAPRS